ncbi:zinc-binding alcohol dehydrogenase, partial [Carbonactinospora thermoautotrophica]
MTHPPVRRTLVIEQPYRARIVDLPEPELHEGCFRVETLYSGLSAGTELSWFRGSNPCLRKTFDPRLRLFTDGQPPAAYPVRKLGYMEVGLVTDTRTPEVRSGSLVSLAIGHATSHVLHVLDDHFVPLPPDLDPLLGVYLAHMGPICANALLHAAAETVGGGVQHLGDGVRGRRVLVTGAGVIG